MHLLPQPQQPHHASVGMSAVYQAAPGPVYAGHTQQQHQQQHIHMPQQNGGGSGGPIMIGGGGQQQQPLPMQHLQHQQQSGQGLNLTGLNSSFNSNGSNQMLMQNAQFQNQQQPLFVQQSPVHMSMQPPSQQQQQQWMGNTHFQLPQQQQQQQIQHQHQHQQQQQPAGMQFNSYGAPYHLQQQQQGNGSGAQQNFNGQAQFRGPMAQQQPQQQQTMYPQFQQSQQQQQFRLSAHHPHQHQQPQYAGSFGDSVSSGGGGGGGHMMAFDAGESIGGMMAGDEELDTELVDGALELSAGARPFVPRSSKLAAYGSAVGIPQQQRMTPVGLGMYGAGSSSGLQQFSPSSAFGMDPQHQQQLPQQQQTQSWLLSPSTSGLTSSQLGGACLCIVLPFLHM